MWTALLPIIGEIIHEGMEMWSEERRTRFKDKYHDILSKLDTFRNRQPKDWIDSDIELAEQELETFLKAYASEVKNENISA
jgi:hypothetical protein